MLETGSDGERRLADLLLALAASLWVTGWLANHGHFLPETTGVPRRLKEDQPSHVTIASSAGWRASTAAQSYFHPDPAAPGARRMGSEESRMEQDADDVAADEEDEFAPIAEVPPPWEFSRCSDTEQKFDVPISSDFVPEVRLPGRDCSWLCLRASSSSTLSHANHNFSVSSSHVLSFLL